MKVRALTLVGYEGKRYAEGEEFEHKDPKIAIEHNLVELVKNGKESKSNGVKGNDTEVQGQAS